MASSRPRNKTGMLEIKADGKFKKKWKMCNIKVSSSMYLLYFKDLDNLTKPDGMVLINNVTKIEPHSAKDAQFAFEVHYKNTKTTPSSPWILNATSNEDRIDWMENIKPNSAAMLRQIMSQRGSVASPPPPTMAANTLPQPQGDKPVPTQRQANNHQDFRTLQHNDRRRDSSEPLTKSLPGHVSPTRHTSSSSIDSIPKQPENYIEPTALPEQETFDPSQSLPANMLRQNGRPPPIARRANKSISHPPRKVHPKLENKASSEKYIPVEDNQYEIMDPLADMESPPPVSPRTVKPKPKPRKRLTPESSPSITRGNGSQSTTTEDILGNVEESDYLSIIDDQSPMSTSPHVVEPPVSPPTVSAGVPPGLAEQLMKNFNKDQLGELVQMLQQVQTSAQPESEVVDAWKVHKSGSTSPEQEPDLSFRGSFKRVLSHTPELSSEKMLVVGDDESYEPRPQWAKAVGQKIVQPSVDHGDGLDTLSALQEDALIILREDLDGLEQIGEGQFGKVFKGTLSRGIEKVQVAVKTTKKSSLDSQHEAFLKEMNIMSQLMHPNIVRLYGLVQKDVPAPWIVLEYLKNGDLKSFLSKNKRPLPKLVKYMVDVSMGMHYLSERGLVHRDLAARNILVSENETCKVADFGLLRELPKDDSFYHMQTNVPCPVRWMPPESIMDRNFSAASDVWSFGILLWEMFNPTKTPYVNLGNIEVATKVMKGYRLPTPRACPPVIARIMKACWHEMAEKRPSFLLISTLLTTKVSFPQEAD